MKDGFLKGSVPDALQNMYGDLLKLIVDVLFLAPDPCFQFWGRRPPSSQSTVSCADMVWTDAMLAVLRWCSRYSNRPREDHEHEQQHGGHNKIQLVSKMCGKIEGRGKCY